MGGETPAVDSSDLRQLLKDGLEDTFPGAVAAIGRLSEGSNDTRLTVRIGERDPACGLPMTTETRFDLASLTKPIVTTTLLFQLVENGTVTLDDQLDRYLPEIEGTDRGAILLHELVTHTSGLQPYIYSDAWESRDDVLTDLLERDLRSTSSDQRFEYSCLNFVHLELVLRRATGTSLATLAEERLFRLADMRTATMGPPDSDVPIVVTYDHDHADRPLRGETNDPLARALRGYSGNAGLFATITDVVKFAETMLRSGTTADGERILSPASIRAMRVERVRSDETAQGYGWRTPINRTPAPIWTDDAIGHTGYTGTSLWLDYERQAYAVLLTNAVFDDVPDLSRFRQRFHALAAAFATSK